MVLRYTSTSLGTMVRSMVATVRVAAARKLERASRLKQVVVRTLESASPTTAHTHSHLVHASPRLQVVHQHARHFSSPAASARAANYGNTSATFGRAGYRPSARMPRGPAVPANVGLGSARTFATAPAQGSFANGANNVPVVLRAFAHIFDDDDMLPHATRYTPYLRRPTRQAHGAMRGKGLRARRRRPARRDSAASTTSSILRDIGHYFPIVLGPVDDEVALPLQPETLVTVGVTTTLALPLSPSLNTLLEPTSKIPYADAEVGVAILAQLTHGILPLHDAYAAAGARIIPLLAKLESLGVLDIHAYPTTTLDVTTNHRGEPDILRVIFSGRSARDVRAFLGDMDEGWWTLSQASQAIIPVEDEDEARVAWRNRPDTAAASLASSIASSATSSSVDLIMPTLDLSIAPAITPSTYELDFDSGYDSQSSWPPSLSSIRSSPSESGMCTPYSMDDSWTSPASPSSPASILSSLSSLSEYEHDRDNMVWISPPSEADADLDAWSDAGIEHQHSDEAQEVEIFWVGGGLSLTQSW